MKKNNKYNIQDYYFNLAKQNSFPSRSYYKLQQIDQRFNLIKRDHYVLDLGSAPGGWTLYLAYRCKKVYSIDLHSLDIDQKHKNILKKIEFFKTDIFFKETMDLLKTKKFNIILSDMSPKTTGNKFVDQCASIELVKQAINLLSFSLKDKGTFIIKLFQSQEQQDLIKELKKDFTKIDIFKPPSVRSYSVENYLIAREYKGNRIDL